MASRIRRIELSVVSCQIRLLGVVALSQGSLELIWSLLSVNTSWALLLRDKWPQRANQQQRKIRRRSHCRMRCSPYTVWPCVLQGACLCSPLLQVEDHPGRRQDQVWRHPVFRLTTLSGNRPPFSGHSSVHIPILTEILFVAKEAKHPCASVFEVIDKSSSLDLLTLRSSVSNRRFLIT